MTAFHVACIVDHGHWEASKLSPVDEPAADSVAPRRHGSRRAAFSLSLASQLALAALGFLLTVLIARDLGPGGRGAFAAALSSALLVSSFAEWGGEVTATAFVVNHGNAASLRQWAWRWCAIVAAPGALLVTALAQVAGLTELTGGSLLYLGSVIPLTVYARVCRGLAIGLHLPRVAAIGRALPGATALLACAILLERDVLSVGSALAMVAVGNGLAAGYFAIALRSSRDEASEPVHLRSLVRFSSGVAVWAAAATVLLRADHIIVGAVLGPSALGLYAYATGLSEVVTYVPAAIHDVVFPRSMAGERAWERWVLPVSVSGAAIAATSMWLLFPRFTRLTVGDGFLSARGAGTILASAAVFYGAGRLAGVKHIAAGRPQRMVIPTLAGVASLVAFDTAAFLSGHRSLQAVACGGLVGYAVCWVTAQWAVRSNPPAGT